MTFITTSNITVPTLTTEEMRLVDKLMVDTYQIELLQMMENAGRDLANLAEQMLQERSAQPRRVDHIVVLAGPGGNGGGGLVAARHLTNRGRTVTIITAGALSTFAPVTRHQASSVLTLGIAMRQAKTLPESTLILDCLLGYGVLGDPHPPISNLITQANQSETPILALDTPSGLDTTTGSPGQPCIHATATMSLALPKSGFAEKQARPFLGDLYLADISVPPDLYRTYLDIDVAPELFATQRVVRLHHQ